MTGFEWMLSPYVVPFLVSALLSLVLALYVVRHPRTDLTDRLTLTLVVLFVLAAQWSVAYLFRLVSTGEGAKLAWVLVEYAGSGFMPVGWFVLTAEYAGYGSSLTRRRLALLCLEPLVAFALVATNPAHHLMWSDVQVVAVGAVTVLERTFGPWFYVHIAYSYTLILVGSYLLVESFVSSEQPYRGQIAALTGAVLVPFVGNVGFVFDLGVFSRIEFTAAGFALANVLLGFAVFRYRLLDLTPISHEITITTLQDAYVVVDRDHRIVHRNPAARELFDLDSSAVGAPVEEHLPVDTDLFVEWEASSPTHDEFSIEVDGERRILDAVVTPVADSRLVGWSLVVRDITDRKRRERELQRQNERLDEFATVVAHDLRNPLNVVRGRIELARAESGNDHLDIAAESIDRIESIVDDTLTLARQGQSVGELETVALRPLVVRCRGTVGTAETTITAVENPTIRADTDRLQRLLENLCRNAVEHGPDDVTVRIGALDGDGFYVEDDGPGIPSEQHEVIFEPGHSRGSDGTGFGLTIVKRIAEAHGWEVRVATSSDGGARFEFTGVDVTDAPRE